MRGGWTERGEGKGGGVGGGSVEAQQKQEGVQTKKC